METKDCSMSVELSKDKNGYNWVIRCRGDNDKDVLKRTREMNKEFQKAFKDVA